MFVRTDDPVRDYLSKEEELQKKLDRLPKCAFCGEPIQEDECYKVGGELVHVDCIDDYCYKNCRVSTDNYVD